MSTPCEASPDRTDPVSTSELPQPSSPVIQPPLSREILRGNEEPPEWLKELVGSSLDLPILRDDFVDPEELEPFVRQLESAPIREVRFHNGVGDWDREELALHVF